MAGLPHVKPNLEQAIGAVERAETEAGSAGQGADQATELGTRVNESARKSLVNNGGGDDDVEQVSGVLLITDVTPNKKTLFKNDCGLLKLLPSKRKFAWEEDMESPSPCQKPEQRKRCFGDDSNRTSCSEQRNMNSNSHAANNVGSFMKWMIDVGKGLAKKRCFPTPLAKVTQRSTNPCFEDSPLNNLLIAGDQVQDSQEQLDDNEDGNTILISPATKEIVSYDRRQEASGFNAASEDEEKAATRRKSEVAFHAATQQEVVEIIKLESPVLMQDGAKQVISCERDSSLEFIATMATVKNWVDCNNFKSRGKKKNKSVPSLNCRYCGLPGHNVSDCSETVDCEVKELEKRETLLQEMRSEVEEFPCLRCLGMGHLGAQCSFSVTEAASRARENSEFRKLTARRRQALSDKVPRMFQRYKETAAHTLKPRDEVPRRRNRPKACLRGEAAPGVPEGFFAAVESVRLSRSELWSLESSEFSTQARGFFIRLRFGRWEKAMGGTGYRMARIRGTIGKPGDDKSMSVSVDLGDMDCTVDSQYVSNNCFTEAELVEWWKGRWRSGKRLISQAELQTKVIPHVT